MPSIRLLQASSDIQIIISKTHSILTTSNLRLLDAVAGVDAMRMNPAMIATSALPLGIPSPETIADDRRSTFYTHKQINCGRFECIQCSSTQYQNPTPKEERVSKIWPVSKGGRSQKSTLTECKTNQMHALIELKVNALKWGAKISSLHNHLVSFSVEESFPNHVPLHLYLHTTAGALTSASSLKQVKHWLN